ncbi:aldehyde dehydrogenase [Prolixibacteraceae bacterium Z1-6]|uniref:Aldehyde dehydrogenase n=1 Tax=Draconibacterium aestuarii TaxID=2998507 RepID=A0A9X3F634_9BACT|nr:aldehyde dehydrogenase [Prolixibacteraceae bacterium Z1-6]
MTDGNNNTTVLIQPVLQDDKNKTTTPTNPFSEIVSKQKEYFNTNATKDIGFRIEQLKKIRALLRANESKLYEAIYNDFSKSEFETYATELAVLYHEINLNIKNIKKWSNRKRVTTGLANFPGKSFIIPEPLGNILVIGPWNYPIHLTLMPAVAALAAGNPVLLKTSELPANTSAVIAQLINDNFSKELFCVVEGGVQETTALLELHFDKIFFTGSVPVGKIIYQAAAKNLTPVTLELGGKSPAIIMADCNINISVKRLVWAKFINGGQTCVAPDYVLVEKTIEEKFLLALQIEIEKYHPDTDESRENYLQIINTKNFDRLEKLIDRDRVYLGGRTNREKRYISPTVLKDVSFEEEIMQEEIFGPILPVLSFTNLDTAIRKIKTKPKPLACYIYSKNKRTVNKVLNEVSFGGGAVNDSVMHLSNSNLPFGGVGFSGIGSYHGKAGFDTFSHQKSIMQKPFGFEPNLKYPPYSKLKMNLIKWLIE